MTRQLLEAIRDQPGERDPAALAHDLGIPVDKIRRQIDRLRTAGHLAPAVYRLAPRLEDAQEKHSGLVVNFGRLAFSISYPVGGRAVADTRDPLVIVGRIEQEGGEYRGAIEQDLEVRIVAALQRSNLRPGDLATSIGVDSHDGSFSRACRWLVEEGLVLDWRAPYPVTP